MTQPLTEQQVRDIAREEIHRYVSETVAAIGAVAESLWTAVAPALEVGVEGIFNGLSTWVVDTVFGVGIGARPDDPEDGASAAA